MHPLNHSTTSTSSATCTSTYAMSVSDEPLPPQLLTVLFEYSWLLGPDAEDLSAQLLATGRHRQKGIAHL